MVFSELDSGEMTRARVHPYPRDHSWNSVVAVASAFCGVSGTGIGGEQEEAQMEMRAVGRVLSPGCLCCAGSALWGGSQPDRPWGWGCSECPRWGMARAAPPVLTHRETGAFPDQSASVLLLTIVHNLDISASV